MAMTKRFKVTFEVTAKLSTEEQKKFEQGLVETAKAIVEGRAVDPQQRAAVYAALYGAGVETAVELAYKVGIRELMRDAYNELSKCERKCVKFSPATVEVLK